MSFSISSSDKSKAFIRTSSLPPPNENKKSPHTKPSVATLKLLFEQKIAAHHEDSFSPRKINRSVSNALPRSKESSQDLLAGSSSSSNSSMVTHASNSFTSTTSTTDSRPGTPPKPKFQLNLSTAYEVQKINANDSEPFDEEGDTYRDDEDYSDSERRTPIIMPRYSSPRVSPERYRSSVSSDSGEVESPSPLNSSLEVHSSPPRKQARPSEGAPKRDIASRRRYLNISPQRQRVNNDRHGEALGIAEFKYTPVMTPQEILQPESPRNPASPRPDITELKFIVDPASTKPKQRDVGKEKEFNQKIQKYLLGRLGTSEFLTLRTPSASGIETDAHIYFARQVKNQIKGDDSPGRANFKELVESSSPRALRALKPLLCNGILLNPIIPRLKFLRNEVYKYMMGQRGKATWRKPKKTVWSENFFQLINTLINLKRSKDPSLVSNFIKTLETQLGDADVHKLMVATFGGEKNFTEILEVLKKWNSESLILNSLKEKVKEIDLKTVISEIDLSIDRIYMLKHNWIELPKSVNRIDNHTFSEIIRCFIPEKDVLFQTITVNQKPLNFEKLGRGSADRQTNFYRMLLQAIYKYYNPKVNTLEIQHQADFMVHLHSKLSEKERHASQSKVQKELSEPKINWTTLEKLLPFKAIPWKKVSKEFSRELHKNKFDDFLAELTIPCLPILKLCVNSCWGRANLCIMKLFPGLFHVYGDTKDSTLINSKPDQGIVCHISIHSSNEYSVTQLKTYGVYLRTNPNDPLSIHTQTEPKLAGINFKWTVGPFIESAIRTWIGTLEIPNLEINPDTPEIFPNDEEPVKKYKKMILKQKTKIIKILNNPKIIDPLDRDVDSPRIESVFRETPATEFS